MDIDTYLNLVTSEHRSRPLFIAMLSAFVQASIDQQTQFNALPSLFDLELAVGDQLDILGAWIGASRNLNQIVDGVTVLPDASYRILLKLLVAQNQWDGTVPGAYALWNTIFAAEGYGIFIQDNQNMTMAVRFAHPPIDLLILAVLTQGYFGLRPAGVLLTGFSDVPYFGWDIEDSSISGWDVGAWF